MMRRAIVVLILALLLLGCVPVPGRIMVAGDSVTQQAGVYGSAFVQQADKLNTVGAGWKAATATPGIRAAVDDPERSPERLAIAFGLNDRDGNVWSDPERAAMFSDVFAPDDAACVVLVKPWATDGNHPDTVAAIRLGLDQLASARNEGGSTTVVVDWRPIVEADPTILGADGVHLNLSTPETAQHAADAFGQMMAAGVAECEVTP